MDLKISSVSPGRNPRKYFDPDEMEELISSIRASGVLQPILVRPRAGGDGYEIVAGERRWRAARIVYGDDGVIPAEVREMTDEEAEVASLVENTLRANMSASEEAEAAYSLIMKLKGDKNEAAAQLGWPLSKIYRRLALMEATPAVRDAMNNRKISLGHAELLAASPKDKQDKVLEKLIANNVSVSVLKEQLSAISHKLEAAIFDLGECGQCPNNSSIQAEMFTQSVAEGYCTNAVCFNEKTTRRLSEIVSEQRENVPRVELVHAGNTLETIPVVAEGRVGVGKEQMESCKGCGSYGVTVSAMPGSEGRIESGVCFDVACHLEKVTAQLKSATPAINSKTPAGKSSANVTQAKTRSTVNESATPQRLKDYRLKIWKDALQAEVGKDAFTAGVALVAIAMTGNAHHISTARLGIHADGSSIDEIFASIAGTPRNELSGLIAKLPVSAIQNLSEVDVRRLLNAMNVDLSAHWVMDAEFMDLLTKSEIESLASEVGIKDAMGDAFKKALTGKKGEVIATLLNVEGFAYRGAVPSCMRFVEEKKTSARKQAKPKEPPQAAPACGA